MVDDGTKLTRELLAYGIIAKTVLIWYVGDIVQVHN